MQISDKHMSMIYSFCQISMNPNPVSRLVEDEICCSDIKGVPSQATQPNKSTKNQIELV